MFKAVPTKFFKSERRMTIGSMIDLGGKEGSLDCF